VERRAHRKAGIRLLAAALGAALLAGASPALANEHDSHRSGHPLRVVAYLVHPIGVVLDTLIFRPAHWVVNWRPMGYLFGHEEY